MSNGEIIWLFKEMMSQQNMIQNQQGQYNMYGGLIAQNPYSNTIQQQLYSGALAGVSAQSGILSNGMVVDQYHKPDSLPKELIKPKTEEKNMLQEFKADAKNFMRLHKGVIYSIIGLYLMDRVLFEGKFKAKLLQIAHKLVDSLEKKVDKIGHTNEGQ